GADQGAVVRGMSHVILAVVLLGAFCSVDYCPAFRGVRIGPGPGLIPPRLSERSCFVIRMVVMIAATVTMARATVPTAVHSAGHCGVASAMVTLGGPPRIRTSCQCRAPLH